jgi:hypothetical protein
MSGNIEETRAILQAAGGTAFPLSVILTTDTRTGAPTSQENWPGMTLRDYFAAKAMPALLHYEGDRLPFIDVADMAYQMADAMIAARKGGA